ncbi:MAG: helix-turn-helix domain-containing protein [Candidatus Niameybacter stercoravium]|nr:helix-turn-helix domain-containing protein [Candidatus Niameybacter stercoravium]
MGINTIKVGTQISKLRKSKGLTQNELGERLNITFQAVSKWERGETLPDTVILVDLANILETTVDNILNGGERIMNYKGKISVSDMIEGINCLEKVGDLIGKDNPIYRHAINGINENMNVDIEECFAEDYKREALIAEAIIQNLMVGTYVDISDVRNNFKHEHFSDVVCKYAHKCGIK